MSDGTWLDDRISAWHDSKDGIDVPLHAHLGMSFELYKSFVEKPPQWVLGLDEVGYGSWAGPLVVGAVLALYNWTHPSLRDSKAVKTMKGRAEILQELESVPGARYFLRSSSSNLVDEEGVFKERIESFVALCKALKDIEPHTLIVIDGDRRVPGIEHVLLPKADSFVPQVMAAAMVAKVSRDTEMVLHARKYPRYGFERNVGYGTPFHQKALQKYGPCPLHRRSIKPIRALLGPFT